MELVLYLMHKLYSQFYIVKINNDKVRYGISGITSTSSVTTYTTTAKCVVYLRVFMNASAGGDETVFIGSQGVARFRDMNINGTHVYTVTLLCNKNDIITVRAGGYAGTQLSFEAYVVNL